MRGLPSRTLRRRSQLLAVAVCCSLVRAGQRCLLGSKSGWLPALAALPSFSTMPAYLLPSKLTGTTHRAIGVALCRLHPATSLRKLPSAGKVVDVQRRTSGGFARGQLRLAGAGAHSGCSMRIDFQNENLVAYREPAAAVETPAEEEDTPPAAPVGSGEGHAVNAPAGDVAPPQGAAAEVVASVPDLICCIESESELGNWPCGRRCWVV